MRRSGPGATNLVTGLVEALNSGTPLVAIVGDSHREHSWKNMTQECRQLEILRPAVKEVIRVETLSRIPELVRRAFAVATSGRPGPVVLDVPEDIAHGVHGFTPDAWQADEVHAAIPALRCRPDARLAAPGRGHACRRAASAHPRRRRRAPVGRGRGTHRFRARARTFRWPTP